MKYIEYTLSLLGILVVCALIGHFTEYEAGKLYPLTVSCYVFLQVLDLKYKRGE